MLSVEDWAEIRRLHRAEGLPIKAIARVLGVSRNTVRAAIASDVPPRYQRTPAGSIVDEVEPRIRELLQAYPRMPATVIAERIGWTRGLTVFKERVAELRPVYLPPDPAGRTSYVAGEIAQCDLWFPPIHLPVGFGQTRRPALLPVLTMITGYSRWLSAMLIPTRSAADLFAGWWQLIEKLAAVPRVLVWDGEGAIGRWRAGKVELTERVSGLPRDPGRQGAGLQTRRSRSQGTDRTLPRLFGAVVSAGPPFASPADFNSQMQQWISVVNTRQRRALGCAPTDRIVADRHAMLALPPVAPVSGRRSSTRLARDHYVRLDCNDYSVHPSVIGRRIEVIADLHRVRVLCEGRVVADHERIWAWHQTISDPDHVAAARALRRERVAVLRPVAELDVEQRPLSDYDTALGLDDIDGGVA